MIRRYHRKTTKPPSLLQAVGKNVALRDKPQAGIGQGPSTDAAAKQILPISGYSCIQS